MFKFCSATTSSCGLIQLCCLLCQNVASEPFEASPFVPKETDDDDDDVISGGQQGLSENYGGAIISEKENNTRESNVAKIKVVVRCHVQLPSTTTLSTVMH